MRGQRLLVCALGVAILVSTCASSNSKAPSRSFSELVKELQDRTTSMTEFRQQLPHIIMQMAPASYEEASQEMSLEELDAIFMPKQQHKRLATSSGSVLQEYQGVQGRPGVDFPVLPSIPKTSFTCKQVKSSGYYADPETDCQVFHICADGRKISFLCPNGTIFRQSHLICDWWWTVDCAASREHYDSSAEQLANDQRIYRARADALAQSRARQQGGRKPGIIREYESTQATTVRPRQLAYNSISRQSSARTGDQRPAGTFSSTARPQPSPQQYSQQPPGGQGPPGEARYTDTSGNGEEIQYEFSKNYYSSQNYQTARPPPSPTQNQLSPFRSAGGTREEFQSEQTGFSSNRQPKQFEQDRRSSGFGAPSPSQQVTSRPASPQTTSRPLFAPTSAPPQLQFSRPLQQAVNRPAQQGTFSQQTGRSFNNRPQTLASTTRNTFPVQNGQQSFNRNNQQQSFPSQADNSQQSGRNLDFNNSPNARPQNSFASFDNQVRSGGQPANPGTFQTSLNQPRPSSSPKLPSNGTGRSYNHYTLFYESEGERQQPAETGSFIGNRGNQFVSPNTQQFGSQSKDVKNLNTEEKIKFLSNAPTASGLNDQSNSSNQDFEFQKNKISKSSKQVLDVALSRRVKPLAVQLIRDDGAGKLIPKIQVPHIELQPPEEKATYNSSGTEEIFEKRQERKMILEESKSAQPMKNQVTMGGQIPTRVNVISREREVPKSDVREVGSSATEVEETTLNSITESNTEFYNEEYSDLEPPIADDAVDNVNRTDISMVSKLLEQPSLFDFSSSSVTTDMPVSTTIVDNESRNISQDSLEVIESDENVSISQQINTSNLHNIKSETPEKFTVVTEKTSMSTGRFSRRRKPTPPANMRFADGIVITTPSATTLHQNSSRKKTKPENINGEPKLGLNRAQNQQIFENNSRAMKARAFTSQAATSTEQPLFSSRSSRYRIPSLRIIEVTIRSSSTPSPFRFTVPISLSKEDDPGRVIDDVKDNIYSKNMDTLTNNNNFDDIISIVSPASPSSRSGRFRTPTTAMPKSIPTVSINSGFTKTKEKYNSTILTKSGTNASVSISDSRRKARIRAQPTSVIVPDSSTFIPPLLGSVDISNESSSENTDDVKSSGEISTTPVTNSEDDTERQLFISTTNIDNFETTTQLVTTTTRKGSILSRRKMDRQKVTKPERLAAFETTTLEENSSGLAIALSQRVQPNRVKVTKITGKENSSVKEETPEYEVTLEKSETENLNGSIDIVSGEQDDGGDNLNVENSTPDPQNTAMLSDDNTENYLLQPVLEPSSEDNVNSSLNDLLYYNKFGVAEYEAENISRKLYVHLNRSESHKPYTYINATGRFLYIEKDLSPQEENTTEYKVHNESNTSLTSSVPIRSNDGKISEGRKSVKYTDLQRQREKVPITDSRRRYKPTTSTEKPIRTTKKSVTSDDSFTQITRSLYTQLTRELLPPKEEHDKDELSLAGISLDISHSNKIPMSVDNSTVSQNFTEVMEQFESSREGLTIPQSLGPKALHSLSVYYANNDEERKNNDKSALNYDNDFDNETNSSTDEISTEENESFVPATLPALLTELTKNSYSRLFSGSNKTSSQPQMSVPTTETPFTLNTVTTGTTEKIQMRQRGRTRSQGRGERARKVDAAIRELQEDFAEKISKSENIYTQRNSSENTTSTDSLDIYLAKNTTPDLRALAQVFSRALSAYLDDPEEFRRALSEIRPTEPSSVTTEEETFPPTFSNSLEVSSSTTATVSSDYPSVTKEKDEVLDFSDVTKIPMLRRSRTKEMKGGKPRTTENLNTDSSSYTTINSFSKVGGSAAITSTDIEIDTNKSRKGKSDSDVTSTTETEKAISSIFNNKTTVDKNKFSEWLHSTPDPSTIAQEVNNLFVVSDNRQTTPPDLVNFTETSFGSNQNVTHFTPTAGGVNDGSRPRYGGFQNNLQIKTVSTDNKRSRGGRRKSTITLPSEEIIEPTTFSPFTKYSTNTETLSTDLTPPVSEDLSWSEEVKKEELIDGVLGIFVPEDLNNLAERDGTGQTAFGDETSLRDSRKYNITANENDRGRTTQNTRRRLGGNKLSETPGNAAARLDVEKINTSTGNSEKVDDLLKTPETHKNNFTSHSRKVEKQVENSQKTKTADEMYRTVKPTRENIIYSKNASAEQTVHINKNMSNTNSALTSEELPLTERKSSVIYSEVIDATPFLLRSEKSKSQNINRNGRQRSRGSNVFTSSEMLYPPKNVLSTNDTNKTNDTGSDSEDSITTSDEANISSTPIPTSGYTSYSNVEITSKSMVRVTPNTNMSRRQSRRFKSTTVATLTRNNSADNTSRHSSRGNGRSGNSGNIVANTYTSDAVSVVTPITLTDMTTPMNTQSTHHSSPGQTASHGESIDTVLTRHNGSERLEKRLQTSTDARNSTSEMHEIMAKFTEAMETSERTQALEHLRRMLSDSKNTTTHEMPAMPELNVTSATALLNVMKSATTNSTVRRLVLLLVNDSLKDNTVEEAQVRFLEAILRLPDELRGSATSRRTAHSRRRPPAAPVPSGSRASTYRRGRKYSTTKTTEEPSVTESSTEDLVDQTTMVSSRAPVDDDSDEKYEIDDRAVSLLRSLFTLASRWG